MISKLSSHLSALCYMPDSTLVCYQYGDIVLIKGDTVIKRFPLFYNRKERLLGRCKLIYRLLRLGVRAAEVIDNEHIVLSVGNVLYEMNINTGEFSDGYYCGKGIRPLIFTTVMDVESFQDGLYFGGYLGNMDKKPVNVYHRIGEDKWDVVYTFPQGAINHVHAIVSDPYRQCLWIFTGDFDEASAIWKVTDGFKKVERVAGNDQIFRGCVGFAIPDGLLYATDAPFAKNHIYLLKDDETLEIVGDISGSCIYGCQWKNKYVFSTAVEADGRNETMLRLLFGWKRGGGIQDAFSRIYVGDERNGFSEIHKEKKDFLPFIFQFGVIKFPTGVNNGDSLYFQPVATQKNDLDLMALR